MAGVLTHLRRLVDGCWHALSSRFSHWTKPLRTSLPLQTLADLGRSKSELIAENALLRVPLIILRRQVKRPAYTNADRVLLVLLARVARTLGTSAHHSFSQRRGSRGLRELFRLYWKRKSKASSHRPKVAADTIALIRQMARENRLWGAERMPLPPRIVLQIGLSRLHVHPLKGALHHIQSEYPLTALLYFWYTLVNKFKRIY